MPEMQIISPQLLAFLSQYGGQTAKAVHAAPDAELQRLSPRYAQLRTMLDEPAVKRVMGESLEAPTTAAPISARAGILEKLLHQARTPEAQLLLQEELEREVIIADFSALVDGALDAGDADLAERLAQQLQETVPDLEGEAAADEPDEEVSELENLTEQAEAAVGTDAVDAIAADAGEDIEALRQGLQAAAAATTTTDDQPPAAASEQAPAAEEAAADGGADVSALADKLGAAWGAKPQ